ncbi:hypothetical protein [Haloarchaeobius baliensis]|uniref:hypothetical protein n=1 Tax=Haloarchaeobius baliensis TaxID=1670458 RepID=UPI003F88534A
MNVAMPLAVDAMLVVLLLGLVVVPPGLLYVHASRTRGPDAFTWSFMLALGLAAGAFFTPLVFIAGLVLANYARKYVFNGIASDDEYY